MRTTRVVLLVAGRKHVFEVPSKGAVVIGAAPGSDLVLNAAGVVARHCAIRAGERGLTVEDLSARRAVRVNGAPVEFGAFRPGDVLRCGDAEIRLDPDTHGASHSQERATDELRCDECGILISMATLRDGQTLEWGETVLCPGCTAGMQLGDLEERQRALIRRLGAEGFTVIGRCSRPTSLAPIFKAVRKQTGEKVALKVVALDAKLPAKIVDRVKAEAEILSNVKHPSCVRVHELLEKADLLVTVMDHVDGQTLLRRIERKGALDEAAVVRIGIALSGALEVVGGRGVVHRNVKPGNVLVSDDATPVLVDFGLAKDLWSGGGLTGQDDTIGTIRYMAPEQAENAREADCRADIYGLGATLLHAVTGKPPHSALSESSLLRRVVSGAIPKIDVGAEGVQGPLAAVLARALAKDPAERYATAAGLSKDLRALLLPDAHTPRPSTVRLTAGFMRGGFESEQLCELAQMFSVTRKTGVLDLRCEGWSGYIALREGRVVAARTTSNRVGTEATLEALAVPSGCFQFRPGLPEGATLAMDAPLEPLLFEAARRRDEASKR